MVKRRLTVAELIHILGKHDPELPVLVEGYENGFDHVLRVEEVSAVDLVEPESWDGQAEKEGDLPKAQIGAGLPYRVGAGLPYQAIFIRGQRGEHRD